MANDTLWALALFFLFVLHVNAGECDVHLPADGTIYDDVTFDVYWNGDCSNPCTLQVWNYDLDVLQYSYTGNDVSVQLLFQNSSGVRIYFFFQSGYGSNVSSPLYTVQADPYVASMSLTSVASIASIASISSISFWSVLSTSTHTSSRTTSTSDFSPTVPPTQRNSTHTTVIIAGAAGGVLALVIFSALLFYCLRFRGSGGQGGADLKGPVAPVPLGGHAGFTGANMGMVGGNVHTLVYPSPGSMTGHHTSDTGGGSGYDNLLTEAANPGNASPPNSPISAGVGSGPSRVANPGSDSSRQSGERSSQGHRGISFPDSSPLGRNPGEGPTVQMSVLRSAPHPVPDGKPEYPYGIPELG